MLNGLRRLFSRWPQRRRVAPVTVHLQEDGFVLRRDDREIAALRWDEVTRVATYKRDNFMWDEIMLDFDYAGPDGAPMHLPVSEECPGFAGFIEVLPQRFPGLSPQWHARVMLPPFEANFAILYERPASPTALETA